MATSVTTSTKKKKLVYKQDPDGVFRLKKVDDTDTDSVNTNFTEKKKKVDDYINELLDCSYKLPEDLEPAPKQTQIEDSTPASSTNNHKSHQAVEDTKSNREKKQTKHKRKASPTQETVNPTASGSIVDTMKKTIRSASPLESAKHFHPQSFILGGVTSVVLYRSQPVLIHYGLILLFVLKVCAVIAVVLGGACWYTGVIKPSDLSNFGTLIEKIKARATGSEIPKQQQSESEDDDEEDDRLSVSDEEQDLQYANKSKPPSIHSIEEPAPPPPTERRRSSIRVTPFRSVPRTPIDTHQLHSHNDIHQQQSRARFQSTPDLHQHKAPLLPRLNTADGRVNFKKSSSPTRSRKGSIETFSSRISPTKSLPIAPSDEELPFINEVKLMDSLNDEVSSLPNGHSDFVKRSHSTASKKSVLGTRANYNKFLAGVPHNDED
ncbi:uncharacterized protein RJT20DRAFT_50060 [Scheffersomyces xylosifermentans]|uniref:uncharacterized protein n=1 Tax=Scheffersomyces xylosifermentans TaxID=1304137 RepID=UPI00315DBAD5